jgi:hypothetical protein
MWLTSKSVVAVSVALAGLWSCGCQSERPQAVPQVKAQPPLVSQPLGETVSPAGDKPDTSIGSASAQPLTAEQNWQEQFESVQAGASKSLTVDQVAITSRQLAQLPELNGQLTQLMVEAGGVSDANIDAIGKLQSLVHVRLRECPIGNQGLQKLAAAGLPELQILNIPHCNVTAVGIKHLLAFPKLVQLRLGGAQLDDRAIEEIARLPKLRSLHLIGPSLTDQSLGTLATSPLLSSFYLDDCPLSDEAWEQLFRAKPQLHIHVDQAHLDRDPNRH